MWILGLTLWLAAAAAAQGPVMLQLVSEAPAVDFGPTVRILTYSEVEAPEGYTRLQIRLRDESPEEGAGGAALFMEELVLTDGSGRRRSNRRPLDGGVLDFHPTIKGGFMREGFIAADGSETILLDYDLTGPGYLLASGPAPADVIRTEVLLLLANDHATDLLLDGVPVASVGSSGNVQDGSNQAFVRLLIARSVGTAVEETSWARRKVPAPARR